MTVTRHRVSHETSRDWLRAALAAVLALTAGAMLLSLAGSPSVWASWAASSVAVVGVLVLIVTGERAWDRMLDSARAAGVVAPS